MASGLRPARAAPMKFGCGGAAAAWHNRAKPGAPDDGAADDKRMQRMSADDMLTTALAWQGEGRKLAIATVVQTWGSAPQPTGSQLVIDSEGNFLGSVSGGCVEGDVITEAVEIIESGEPKLLEFGVQDETAWRAGLACGGRIRIFVEPFKAA